MLVFFIRLGKINTNFRKSSIAKKIFFIKDKHVFQKEKKTLPNKNWITCALYTAAEYFQIPSKIMTNMVKL